MTTPTWDPVRWQRVAALFEQAMQLSPDRREAFLQQMQVEATGIAQAVARMLAADAAFATDTPPNAASVLADAFDAELPVGTQLGAYAIESCLGTGGMGRVYRARRVEGGVTQTVAIKCLRFRSRDPEFSRRFQRERRILAQLTHPNIARFLDVGTDADGQPFVVIEYIDGATITDFARTQCLPLRARLELLLKVMRAVAYSHRQLVVHRDIKPGNVLVATNGEPQLLDFGIAKQLMPDDLTPVDGETALEHRAFSLGHAAPEQLQGAAVGTACDIYALGVLAYELICAQPPLALAGVPFAEAQHQVLEVFPTPPSERLRNGAAAPDGSSTAAWQRALRGDLDNIVLHALKKEPNERYPTVDAFIDDVRRYLDDEAISLRSGHRWYRARKFVRRHRLAVGLAVGLLVALSAGSVALWRQNLATEAQRDTALAQRRKAEALNGLLLDAFEAADPSRNRGKEVTAREVLDQAARRVNDDGMDVGTRVSLLTAVADVYRTLGLSEDSAGTAQRAVDQAGEAPSSLARARALRALAQARFALGEFDAAEAALARAQALPPDADVHAARAETMEREQVSLQIMIGHGRAAEALDLYAALYASAKREFGGADALTLRCGKAYAEQLRLFKRMPESAALVDELLRAIPDPGRDPTGVRLLGTRARNDRDLHQMDSAIVHAGEYVTGVRLLYGEHHRSYVGALDLLSSIEEELGRYDRAIALMREMLTVLSAISDKPESTTKATVLNNLANVLHKAGRMAEAKLVATQSVNMAIASMPTGSINLATFRTTLAEVLIELGEFAPALSELDQSEVLFAAAQSANSPGIVRAFGQVLRAEALLGLGRRDEAELALARGWPKLRDLDPGEARYRRAIHVSDRLQVDLPQQPSSAPTAAQ